MWTRRGVCFRGLKTSEVEIGVPPVGSWHKVLLNWGVEFLGILVNIVPQSG